MEEERTRITGERVRIEEQAVKRLYAERARSRAAVDVDAPVVLASDKDPKHIAEWNRYEVEHWLPYLKLDRDSHVLELGFGTGRIAKYIIEQAGSYTGIDYVEEFVETVKRREDIRPAYETAPVFLQGSFRQLVTGELNLPRQTYDRFVISGGVLMYINDEDAASCLQKLPELLTKDSILYISEPVALTERLTLKGFFSEDMQSEYSAIYRTEKEYTELFRPFLDRGFSLTVNREFFEEDIKGQKETRQWMFLLEGKR